MRNPLMLIAAVALTLSLAAAPASAAGNNPSAEKTKQKKSVPFLITGKLPHLTRQLMTHWDSSVLALTPDQKNRLLVVREKTIGAVQRLGKELAPLEKQVAAEIFSGKTPDDLRPLVSKIADLKAEATMVHLRCIYDTAEILDQQQMDYLRHPPTK